MKSISSVLSLTCKVQFLPLKFLDHNFISHLQLIFMTNTTLFLLFCLCIIYTDACRIPLQVLDKESIQNLTKLESQRFNYSDFKCRPNPLLSSNKTHIWLVKKNMRFYDLNSSSKVSCCYRSFYTPKLYDPIHAHDGYSACREFTDTINVDDEFVRVNCSTDCGKKLFDSFFMFAVEKQVAKANNLPYNVLILGLDGVSRLNFHRTMPKTVRCLKKYGAVELLGYNKVGYNTFPNLVSLLTGLEHTRIRTYYSGWRKTHWTLDPYPFIWKRFQEVGFVTAFAEDNSRMGTFNHKERGFQRVPTHYYLDPFLKEAEDHEDMNNDYWLSVCMNEKHFFKLLLDYVEDLTTLKNKLFGFFWEYTMSHDYLLLPTVIDDSYSMFLQRLHASGYLNDTILFILSDHGIRHGPFRQSKQGFLEERLPLMFALMPPTFIANFTEANKNLKLNSGRLTTPFDMHATLMDLVDLENIKNDKILSRSRKTNLGRGVSLFLPISGKRTCKSAGIEDYWCTCQRNSELKLDKRLANRAILHAISHLNGLLENYPQCSKLTFHRSLEVIQLMSNKEIKDFIELFVMFQTMPGGGVFETILEGRDWYRPWAVSSPISRLNLYGNQSHCVTDPQLRLYCYCAHSDHI